MGRRLECGFCAHRFDVVSDAPQGVCPHCAARWSGLAGGLLDWDKPEELKEKLKRLKSVKRHYVTKYALSLGIIEVTPEMFIEEHSGYLYFKYKQDSNRTQVGPRDWFTDLAKAQARAEMLRTDKIKSLQKQIDKLRKKSFE